MKFKIEESKPLEVIVGKKTYKIKAFKMGQKLKISKLKNEVEEAGIISPEAIEMMIDILDENGLPRSVSENIEETLFFKLVGELGKLKPEPKKAR